MWGWTGSSTSWACGTGTPWSELSPVPIAPWVPPSSMGSWPKDRRARERVPRGILPHIRFSPAAGSAESDQDMFSVSLESWGLVASTSLVKEQPLTGQARCSPLALVVFMTRMGLPHLGHAS